MAKPVITKTQQKLIDELVNHFEANQHQFALILEQLFTLFTKEKMLYDYVHSMKWRVKDPSHLRGKLIRKMLDAKTSGKSFDIGKENLFYKINDLAGFRIIHLYTRQIDQINQALISLFEEGRYRLKEGPIAKTWDDESRSYFKEIGIKTEISDSLYTSVHYVVEPNRRTKYTCEIQVRTLMEEVWGEVSHTVNYPHPTDSVACDEQIKVLARVTSSCSRLVDSIFKSDEDYRRNRNENILKQSRSKGKSKKKH